MPPIPRIFYEQPRGGDDRRLVRRRRRQRQKVRQRQKAARQPQRQPYDPLAPLAGRDFNREINALTRMQYRPQFREIARQNQQSVRHEQGMGDWYSQVYIPSLEQAAQRQQQAYSNAQASQQQAATGMAQMAAQQTQALQAQAAESAAARGATVDPSLFADMANAAGVRQADTLSQAGLIGALGAAQAGYQAQQVPIARSQELGFRRQEADYRRDLSDKRADLMRERQEFKRGARGQLRAGERTYALERKAFGLKEYEAKVDAKNKKANRRLNRARLGFDMTREQRRQMESDRKFRLDADKHGRETAKDRYQRRHGLGSYRPASGGSGPSNLTPTQRRGYQRDFGRVYSEARGLNLSKVRGNPSGAVDGLVREHRVDRLLARGAVERALHGGVSPALARKIKRRFGVKVKVRQPNTVRRGRGPAAGGTPQPRAR